MPQEFVENEITASVPDAVLDLVPVISPEAFDLAELHFGDSAERSSDFHPDASGHQQLQQVTDIRNAVKLGAKFFKGKQEQLGNQVFSLCSMAFDVGLILALAGERRDVVVAGILHNALSTPLERSRDEVRRTISRKFGSEVCELIETLTRDEAPAEPDAWRQRQQLHLSVLTEEADRDVATLSCAVNIALIETANRYLTDGIPFSEWSVMDPAESIAILELQLARYEALAVSDVLLEQFREASARFARETEGEAPRAFESRVSIESPSTGHESDQAPAIVKLPQILRDAQTIRYAAQLSSDLFEDVPRKWGPTETLPLSAHEYEVGMLLALAGESRDLIIAGLLHDVFEDYVQTDEFHLRDTIRREFGTRVLELIERVTEPPKSSAPGNWWDRKLMVLYKIRDGDKDAATLACAAKISTLAAGNKMLYMGRPVSEWSSGPLEDNVRVFNFWAREFECKGVSPLLLNQFRAELELFKRGTIERRGHEMAAS